MDKLREKLTRVEGELGHVSQECNRLERVEEAFESLQAVESEHKGEVERL